MNWRLHACRTEHARSLVSHIIGHVKCAAAGLQLSSATHAGDTILMFRFRVRASTGACQVVALAPLSDAGVLPRVLPQHDLPGARVLTEDAAAVVDDERRNRHALRRAHARQHGPHGAPTPRRLSENTGTC